ncbi:MAG: PepSY domain-containing protein [Pyrinomonadaceae bacterium]
MKRRNYKHYVRKSHRYLGIFIGIQFFLWTLGGLYFSWTDLDEVHGDHLHHKPAAMVETAAMISPTEALISNSSACKTPDFKSLMIVSILGDTFYSLACDDGSGRKTPLLISAIDGKRRAPLSESEARSVAAASMHEQREIKSVELITEDTMGRHHEYREKPMPAWAVTFDGPEEPTAYVAATDGQVHAMRTTGWRVFDFLWMLHTMDFAGRDNINNYVLRAFSVLGICTVMSGFLLFAVSSKGLRRILLAKKIH